MADPLEALREFAFDDGNGEPLVLTVEKPLKPHGQRLMDSLGVRVEVRPVSPLIDVQDATSSADCLQPGCPFEAESGRTHCRHHRRLGETVVLAARRLEDRPAVAEPSAPPSRPAARLGATTPRKRWTREEIIEAIQAHAREHGYPPVASEWALQDATRPTRDDAKRVFGSWADAVEAAGFPRPRRGVSARHLKDSSSEGAADPQSEEGPRSPTPTRGGLDDEQPGLRAPNPAATDVAGGPEPGPGPNHDTTSEERAVRRLGPEAARSSDAEATPVEAGQPEQRVRPEGVSGQHRVTGGLPEPERDPLSVASMTAEELVACGRIMQAVAASVYDLSKPERVRVAAFVAALLKDVDR